VSFCFTFFLLTIWLDPYFFAIFYHYVPQFASCTLSVQCTTIGIVSQLLTRVLSLFWFLFSHSHLVFCQIPASSCHAVQLMKSWGLYRRSVMWDEFSDMLCLYLDFQAFTNQFFPCGTHHIMQNVSRYWMANFINFILYNLLLCTGMWLIEFWSRKLVL